MAVDDRGERNRPIYAGAGAPADAEDLTYLGKLATDLGTRRAGTSAARKALEAEWLFEGLQWFETDTGLTYVRTTTAWVLVTLVAPRLRMTRPGDAGIQATTWTAVNMSAASQDIDGFFGGGGSAFTVPMTARYLVNLKAVAPATPSPNRRIIGLCPSSAISSPIMQSPGYPSDGNSATIDHTSEVTLQAGTQYSVGAYTTAPLNFRGFDASIRLIAPTSIG